MKISLMKNIKILIIYLKKLNKKKKRTLFQNINSKNLKWIKNSKNKKLKK